MEKDLQNIYRHLSELGEEKTVKSHTTLIAYGEKVNKLFLILKGGMILLHVHPKTGAERAINFFIPDFHPIASIAEPYYLETPSEYHLKTFTNTTYIEIKKADFDAFLSTSEYGKQMMDYGIRSLLQKNEIRAKLISYSSEEMLQYLHEKLPQILQNIPSKYVANFLGITPQWLSKLKRTL